MNFVAGTLLLIGHDAAMPDHRASEFATTMLDAFIHNLHMNQLWRPGVPQLKLRVFQFDHLLQSFFPRLHATLQALEVSPDFFASQWFLTLLTYHLPQASVVRIWDVLLTDGWKTVFRVGLAIVSALDQEEEVLTLESLSLFFRRWVKAFPGETVLLEKALTFKVSTRKLIRLESEYVGYVFEAAH